jgi:arylformamidase
VLCAGGLESSGFKHQTLHFRSLLEERGSPVRLAEHTHNNHFNLVNELADPQSALFRATLEMIG